MKALKLTLVMAVAMAFVAAPLAWAQKQKPSPGEQHRPAPAKSAVEAPKPQKPSGAGAKMMEQHRPAPTKGIKPGAAPGGKMAGEHRPKPTMREAGGPDVAKRPAWVSGLKVVAAQKVLNKSGFKLIEDGLLGPRTSQALMEYQKTNGLQPSGKLDKATMMKMGIK